MARGTAVDVRNWKVLYVTGERVMTLKQQDSVSSITSDRWTRRYRSKLKRLTCEAGRI
jgi:hypothetical protein